MHKRHARWIAAVAIAGTGVLTSAAAVSATSLPQPRQASPATCAGLAADLTTTVGEAAKDLLATPPNLTGATTIVGDAVALNNAIIALGCAQIGALPTALPTAPSLPTAPAVPTAPALPTDPSVPSMPTVPSLPSLPTTPSLPTGAPSAQPTTSLSGVTGALPTGVLGGLTSALPTSPIGGLTGALPSGSVGGLTGALPSGDLSGLNNTVPTGQSGITLF